MWFQQDGVTCHTACERVSMPTQNIKWIVYIKILMFGECIYWPETKLNENTILKRIITKNIYTYYGDKLTLKE